MSCAILIAGWTATPDIRATPSGPVGTALHPGPAPMPDAPVLLLHQPDCGQKADLTRHFDPNPGGLVWNGPAAAPITPAMGVPFLKMNGLGNDFVVLDVRRSALRVTPEVARRIGDRHRGVGFDQLLVIEGAHEGADAFMRIWNPDGSQSGACGNGARCVADVIMTESRATAMRLATEAGVLACTRADHDLVTVDMGKPRLEWQQIPLAERMDTRTLDIKVGPIDAPVLFGPSAVNMGNPHCVFFVPDAGAHDLKKIGSMLEYHPLFPERANISLAQVRNRNEIRLRVWERGVGITQACGSAACASVVAAARKRLTDRTVTVELDGGKLHIQWRDSDDHVLMTGPTEINYAGELPDRVFEQSPS